MKPTLTRARWQALKLLEEISGPFTGAEVDVRGPSLVSLEECGWVERVTAPEQDTPFAIATQGHHWRVTKAGRAAIAALPATAPRRM
jgi:hypothetical protein